MAPKAPKAAITRKSGDRANVDNRSPAGTAKCRYRRLANMKDGTEIYRNKTVPIFRLAIRRFRERITGSNNVENQVQLPKPFNHLFDGLLQIIELTDIAAEQGGTHPDIG